ncbi:hypothetical protein NMG60_11002988 [Bertholletia excelsa]
MGGCGRGLAAHEFLARSPGKLPAVTRRKPDQMLKCSGGPGSLSVMIFGSLEKGNESPDSLGNSNDCDNYGGGVDDFEVEDDLLGENMNNAEEENKAFWESKEQLLQAILYRSSSIETRLRHATKEALRELMFSGTGCACRRPVADSCRSCLQKEISDRLQLAGYSSTIRKSKWRSSPDIPSGEHTYLEVVDSSSKKGMVRLVIELNFRAEFEMARADEGYNRLIGRLPDIFVGKAERLQALIKILCSAAKKCMKDRKMHMGPWRKHKYMQAKWFGTTEAAVSKTSWPPVGFSSRLPKPTASMLTFDLGENLPVLQSPAVGVV